MRHCHQCGFPLSESSDHAAVVCAQCGQTSEPTPQGPAWTSIARVSSLADVGYFEDLLSSDEIDCRVHERDDFSAVDGTWQKTYVVQVPEHVATRAVERLRGEIAETEDVPAAAYDAYGSASNEDTGPALWKPLALILLAGGLVYMAGRSGPLAAGKAPQRHEPAGSLWNALTESDIVLKGEGDAGQGRRALRYDPIRERLILEVDTNGDGRFDRRREFRSGRLVHESMR